MTSAQSTTPAPPPRKVGFRWGDFFGFRLMITPILTWAVYLIGVVVITIVAIYAFLGTAVYQSVNGVQTSSGSILGPILTSIVIFLVGNLVWRVYMELMIVLFRINGSLQKIERRGRGM